MRSFTDERSGSTFAEDSNVHSSLRRAMRRPSSNLLSTSAGVAVMAALTLLAAVGCTGILDSSAPTPTFQAQVAADNAPEPFTPTAGSGFFRFRGHITTPNRCQDMRARLERFSESNGVIELVVDAETIPGCAEGQETLWNYLITLNGVPAGDYSVTVTHVFEDGGTSEVVFEGDLSFDE